MNSQWVIDPDQTLPHNYSIVAYGAQFLAGAAVTGHAIQVYKGYNNHSVVIEGMHFNHRGNTTVNGAIQALGTTCLRLFKCVVESHNTKGTYAAFDLGPYTIGDNNTCAFWTTFDSCATRMRSGADGTAMAVGIRLRGTCNATNILNCSFATGVDAIRFDTDGTAGGLANGCTILHNHFEGVTNAVTINTAAPCTAMPTGLRMHYNRLESLTTVFNITGAAVTNASFPPDLGHNYLTVGSVTNYVVNPNTQYVFSYEPSSFGIGINKVGGPLPYTIIAEGVGNHLTVANFTGLSAWNGAHLVLGAYHLWVDSATGKLYIKGSAPTSATDGTVVGTQV